MTIIPVILSGGSGTRLWPLSRSDYPKQFHPLVSEKTMLQETVLRLAGIDRIADPVIVCNKEHRFSVAEQMRQIAVRKLSILLEPVGRDTAAAIAVSAKYVSRKYGDENSIIVVLSADHYIEDVDKFQKTVFQAAKIAVNGKHVILGIEPEDANIGYGYIKAGSMVESNAYDVEYFIEKPNQEKADEIFDQDGYLWNCGIFVFKTDVLIKEISEHSHDLLAYTGMALEEAIYDNDFVWLNEDKFNLCEKISIDYALLEKSSNLVVVVLRSKWSDVGTWSSLYNVSEKNNDNNVLHGDVLIKDVKNCYLNGDHHLVVALGVKDLIVVDTPDATLVSDIKYSQNVKEIAAELLLKKRSEYKEHRKVYRPWGWYDSIESGEYFKVKKLHVNPGGKLSLQFHEKRAEHWIVVEGVAIVIKSNESFVLNEGESTFIPAKEVHSLKNDSDEPLVLIEVQSGTYLEEDDITRLDDIYGRNGVNIK